MPNAPEHGDDLLGHQSNKNVHECPCDKNEQRSMPPAPLVALVVLGKAFSESAQTALQDAVTGMEDPKAW